MDKTLIVSYSNTGNNEALATNFVKEISADHVRIHEIKKRSMGTIIKDVMFNREPKIEIPENSVENYDLVVFIGPVWLGHVASPFRSYFKQIKDQITKYAYISISGGADGPDCNKEITPELEKRLGKAPEFVLDLHIADLLPSEPQPTRDMTMQYRINTQELGSLMNSIKASLKNEPTLKNNFA